MTKQIFIADLVRERLQKAGIPILRCKACGREIFFVNTKNGRQQPLTLELISHFADCPNAKKFRFTAQWPYGKTNDFPKTYGAKNQTQ